MDTTTDNEWAVMGPDAVCENRALVPFARTTDRAEPNVGRQHIPFIAQLVATKDQHPQTRQLRRADPSIASAAYRATAALNRV